MNLHPIIVHFPIALLTLYGVLEIVRLPILTRQQWYFFMKAVLVILGSLASWLAVLSGTIFEKFQKGNPILDYHEFFGYTTAIIFSFIALSYALVWYSKYMEQNGVVFESKIIVLIKWIVNSYPVFILALLGLGSVTITGGLGGVMVFGPDADPFFKPIYKLIMKIKF